MNPHECLIHVDTEGRWSVCGEHGMYGNQSLQYEQDDRRSVCGEHEMYGNQSLQHEQDDVRWSLRGSMECLESTYFSMSQMTGGGVHVESMDV